MCPPAYNQSVFSIESFLSEAKVLIKIETLLLF